MRAGGPGAAGSPAACEACGFMDVCPAAAPASACLPSQQQHKYLRPQVLPSLSRRLQEKRTLTDMVLLRVVTFGLLAVLWSLTPAAEAEVIYACHNQTASISCDVGRRISLDHILYKVGVGTRCGEGKRFPDDGEENYCSFPWAEMVVEDLCGNKRSCDVPVTEWVFGEYECKEQTRYLEVSFTCTAPPPPPPPPPPPTKPDCEDKSPVGV